MKIKHYNDAIDWLTRPKFNGGGSVKNKEVLPKRKPEEELKKRKKKRFEKLKEYLENPEEVEEMLELQDGGRIQFQAGTYPKTNPQDLQKLRNYLKNLKESPQTSKLSKQFNIDRRTINLILEREFPDLVTTPGQRQAANVAEMNKLRKEATEAGYEKILKEGFLDDYKLKIETPSGSPFAKGLTNAQLAK